MTPLEHFQSEVERVRTELPGALKIFGEKPSTGPLLLRFGASVLHGEPVELASACNHLRTEMLLFVESFKLSLVRKYEMNLRNADTHEVPRVVK